MFSAVWVFPRASATPSATPSSGLDVPGIDFLSITKGFGEEGETVEEAESLPGALERALAAERPYPLDVIVDPVVPKLLS